LGSSRLNTFRYEYSRSITGTIIAFVRCDTKAGVDWERVEQEEERAIPAKAQEDGAAATRSDASGWAARRGDDLESMSRSDMKWPSRGTEEHGNLNIAVALLASVV
jgi:hypothetical protein